MHVTISYRDYIPHQGVCLVEALETMVAFNDMVVDDDNNGNSNGNSDGNANPTETVKLEVELKNFGVLITATNVVANLSSNNPSVQIINGSVNYPDIPAGQVANSGDKFVVHLNGNIPHDEVLMLPLTAATDQGTYESSVFLLAKSMKFSHHGESFPDGGANLDPGETASMIINVINIGELDGVNLTGTLSCDDSYISISDNTADFGTINIGGSGSNGSDYFTVTANSMAYDGRNVNFALELTSDAGVSATTMFNLVLGNVNQYDAVGPDNYGYYMYDNIDTQYGDLAPTYSWVEISTIGIQLSFYSTDDASALVALPFDFVYYGETYRHIIACINGFIAVDTFHTQPGWYFHNWDNYPIPDPGCARGQISPFWDDLRLSSGHVYKYYDSSNNRFIIEWKNLRHANTNALESFQVLIYDPDFYPTPTGDAEIVFQYQTIVNNDAYGGSPNFPEAYSSVGLENWDEDDGLQYEWNNIYHPAAATLAAGRAIKITTSYITPSNYEYLPGDANMYNGLWPPQVIGGDVTYLVNYFRGVEACQPCPLDDFWCSADANGDCNIIGSDVTRLVNYFRGNVSLLYCPDYEPLWLTPDDLPAEAPVGWPNCDTPQVMGKVLPSGDSK